MTLALGYYEGVAEEPLALLSPRGKKASADRDEYNFEFKTSQTKLKFAQQSLLVKKADGGFLKFSSSSPAQACDPRKPGAREAHAWL